MFAVTRVPRSEMLKNVARGATIGDFVERFPCVDEQKVRIVLEHQARILRFALAR